MTDPLTGIPAHGRHLIGDFSRRQIALQSADSRRAENVAHPAAGLGGNTRGISVPVPHKDALDGRTAFYLKEIFSRPVFC